MLYLSPYHRPVQISATVWKFRKNGQIPRLGSKFRIPQKTVVPSNGEYGLLAAYGVSQSGLWLKLVGLIQRSVAVCYHAVFIG